MAGSSPSLTAEDAVTKILDPHPGLSREAITGNCRKRGFPKMEIQFIPLKNVDEFKKKKKMKKERQFFFCQVTFRVFAKTRRHFFTE